MTNPYRNIPSVNVLVDLPSIAEWSNRLSRSFVVEVARQFLDDCRSKVADGSNGVAELTMDEFAARLIDRLEASQRPPLGSVINATGIIIHTGLGRSPLADEVVEVMADVARGYAPVELDMSSGQRGKRSNVVKQLLCEVTGAESGTAVNNNAAAMLLVLSALAKGREVIVSRGELIEIGGSFRLPDVMQSGGAILREVGTTNKTRLSDYANAINDNTALIMKVHSSNYRIEGFTEAAAISDLAELAHHHDISLIDDVGSGALVDFEQYGLADEPDVRSSIAAGSDLVLFSGDKLLGGPQAGIIVGKRELVDRVEKDPMMRALRLDKVMLTGLAATLQLHRDAELATERVPVLKMLTTPLPALKARADDLVDKLRDVGGVSDCACIETTAYMGGGTVPTQGVPSLAVSLKTSSASVDDVSARLRGGGPGVVARVHEDALVFDMRTVAIEQDEQLAEAIRSAVV